MPKVKLRLMRCGRPAWSVLPLLLLPSLLGGCNRSAAPNVGSERALSAEREQQNNEIRSQLALIPPPSKNRYLAVRNLNSWENPFVTVQDDMVTLHVTLADANTSALGQGGLLRPVGARKQDLNVRVGELPAALNAVPPTAWPYGRVIAVEEAHQVPASARPAMRRNIEIVMKTLGDLDLVAYEWTENGPGLH